MGLNEVMEKLKADVNTSLVHQPAPTSAERDEPLTLTDEVPTIRDFSTALYKLTQSPTCRNCIRRERNDCPSKTPMPKTCVSFQLNSRQMQTYGQQAHNVIRAWRDAVAIHAARSRYITLKTISKDE